MNPSQARFWRPDRALVVLCLVAVLAGAGASAASAQDAGGPLLRSVWGDPGNGRPLTLMGQGFGSVALDVQSGAGPGGWIETNPAGTTFAELVGAPGWDIGPASDPPLVTGERAHSGAHSALSRIDAVASQGWQAVMRYRHPTAFRSIYASWWIYFDPMAYAPRTQWKHWRVNDNGSVSDNCSNLWQSSEWTDGQPVYYQTGPQCVLDCPGVQLRECMAKVVPHPYYAPRFEDPFQYMNHDRGGTESFATNHTTPGTWCRFEIFVESSDLDVANGTFLLAITKPDQPRKVVDQWTGMVTHRSDCCRDASDPWQWFMFQNYFDDNGGAFEQERADFFLDDIHLQFGTQARVELGNRQQYSACTQLEVQIPTRWTDDSITVTLNQGAFAPGQTAYLFVIADDGKASAGLPVLLR